MDLEIVPLEAFQIGAAAGVLARAFFDDPLSIFILPDDAQRLRAGRAAFAASLRAVLHSGRIDATARLDGVACWLPPTGESETGATPSSATEDFAGLFGESAMHRLNATQAFYAELRQRTMPEPHWFLTLLGVDPPHQRQGIGARLLERGLQWADGDGLPCYLETEKARNVPFYQRYGFEVLEHGDLPGGGPPFWTMRRPTRP